MLAAFSSCQSEPEETSAPEGQCTITFSVSNYRQISFDDLSGSAATTRAKDTVRLDLANLSLTVFDAETNKQVSPTILHYSDDYYDENNKPKALLFPKFSVTLPYGHYRVLALGYNGKKECNIASLNHITWAEDYVPNTFLYCEEFTLNEGTSLNKEITLRRVVSAFRVTAEDAIPADLKKMRFISSVGGTVLDAMTGFAPQSTGRTSDITIPPDSIGKQGVCFTAYLFLPQEQVNGSYTVQALDKNNAIFCQKLFNDVPLRINYKTEWQGNIFEASDDETPNVQSGFNINWSMDWAGTLKLEP